MRRQRRPWHNGDLVAAGGGQTSIAVGVSARYEGNNRGRRSPKTLGGTTTSHFSHGLNLVAETTSGQTSNFLNGGGLDEPLAMSIYGVISYFSVHPFGSVSATNDPTGTINHNAALDAGGNTRTETGTRQHRFTYTGREVGEAGLLFYRARFYQPGIGRFTQEDLDRSRNGTNLFAYANSSPLNFVDPLGLSAVTPDSNEKYCTTDLCKSKKSMMTPGGGEIKPGDDCTPRRPCWTWAEWAAGGGPPEGPPSPHAPSRPALITYTNTWGGAGHGAYYDGQGCGASCSLGDWTGTPVGPRGQWIVVFHSPRCHPRGSSSGPWRPPQFY